MSYYRTHYPDLRFPIATAAGQSGLRKAQLGALWGVASHFTVRQEPALVVMPTGSGKTAVVTLVPFLLQAERVLVITSNRPVRGQITSEFKTQRTLINLGVVPDVTTPGPKVKEITSRVPSAEGWANLKDFDVVVAHPSSVSPALGGVAAPPPDLFDVVLVDEAHHQPADTWNAILAAFPTSRRAFFTATPTRRDRKQIQARLVYAYSVAAAQADGFFGTMRFIPVQPQPGEQSDVAVARAAAEQVRVDREAGLKHCLLVRTDEKAQAEKLSELYRQTTPQLRLDVVHSGRPYKTITKTLEKLKREELDGIICVDMMSEGFDFPRLKIAAIHIPHRSLEVTLQFVGRFARTNDAPIGEAKFLAVPSEIASEVSRLYSESVEWDTLVADLSQARLDREQHVREVIAGFHPAGSEPAGIPSLAVAVPLYTLRPQFHVMVVECQNDIDLKSRVTLPPQFRIERHEVNEAEHSVILISNERERPKWTTSEALSRSEYDLFVLYFDPGSRLLFMCASRPSPDIYDRLAASYTRGVHRTLPTYQLNRILNGLTQSEFFNVGMRSRIVGDRIEAYRIVAGSSAQKAITKTDARFFSRGHVMGQGHRNGQREVIGYSSGSKIWSPSGDQVALLLQWCRDLATRMVDTSPPTSQGDLDHLPIGECAAELPKTITFIDWTENVYRNPIPELVGSNGNAVHLGDIDLAPITHEDADDDTLEIEIRSTLADPPRVLFDLGGWPHFTAANKAAEKYLVRSGRESSRLLAYLNSELLDIYGPDFSRVRGREVFKSDPGTFEPFDRLRIETLDWSQTDIACECGTPAPGKGSVQDCVRAMLSTHDDGVIVFDHRTGEVADFVHVRRGTRSLVFTLYHCKGSATDTPGSRVEDAYEVCGQVVRSIRWVGNERGLLTQLSKRLTTGSTLVLGTEDELRAMRGDLGRLTPELNVCLVQPGFSRDALDASILDVLAATDDYVRRGRATLRILGSD